MLIRKNAPQPAGSDPIRTPRRMMTWQAVQSEILSRIRSGQWPAGELIPTETVLAAEFGCARATINRAMTSLAESGLLERRRKIGTRVARHPPQRSTLPGTTVRDEIESEGGTYGYRLIARAEEVAPLEVSRLLTIGRGQPTLNIRAVFLADDQAYCCEERWINPEAAPGVDNARFESIPAMEWLNGNVGLNHGTVEISAVSTADLPDFIGESLGLGKGEPVMLIERAVWSDAVAVSLSRQYFHKGHRLKSLI